MLARAALNGGASHLTATRLDMIGGLTELAADLTLTTPIVMKRATCPFCEAQTEDSLQHFIWDCKSDRHLTATGKVINAEETVKRMRQRFQSGMMAAMLGTGCPLLTGKRHTGDGEEGTGKAARSAQPLERKARERKEATVVTYDVIRSIAKAKIRAKLQHQPAHLWFQGKERAVEADRARLRQAKARGLKRTAATKAQAVMIERLASTIADERAGWLRWKGDDDIMSAYVDTPAKVSPALDCPTRGEETEETDAALPESVLFAHALVASFYSLGSMEAVGIASESDGPWTGNTWAGLAPGRQPYQTSAPPESSLPTLRYGGLVDCRVSWTEARRLRKGAREAEQPLLYIAIAGITAPTAMVGHALAAGEWLLRNEGQNVRTHGYLMYVPDERFPDPTGIGYLPAPVRQWKRLWMDTDEDADPSLGTPDCLRRQLAECVVQYQRHTGSETWWQHALRGAEGQCRGAGLIGNETHQELQPHMTKNAYAQLYASYHWQMGVLVSSLVSCRSVVAELVTKAEQGMANGEFTTQLQRFIRALPPVRPRRRGATGWLGVDRTKGGLPVCETCCGSGTAKTNRNDQPSCAGVCPSCAGSTAWTTQDAPAEESDDDPPDARVKKVCRHLPPRAKLIEVLRQLGREWATTSPGTKQPHGIIGPGACDGCSRAMVAEGGVEAGLLLVDGQVLCELCAVRWTEQVRKRLLLDRGEQCVYLQTTKPKRACCLKCWSRNPTAVADFRSELRRMAANHLLSQLTRSDAVSFKRALVAEIETMGLAMPTTEDFGVPVTIMWRVSSWLQRHASHWLRDAPHLADTSLRVDFTEAGWVALRSAVPPPETQHNIARGHGNLHSETVRRTEGLSEAKGLANLRVVFKKHNNVALPKTRARLCMLPVLIGLDDKRDSLTLAEPADSHVTQSEQAKCQKCVNSEGDAFGDQEGKQVYHCLACNAYLHEDCMSSRERETVRLHDHLEEYQPPGSLPPEDLELGRIDMIKQYYKEMQTERDTISLAPWRCADCTTNQQFAMTRILELSHTPAGKLMAVVEYTGYTTGELIPMELLIDPSNALTDAFQAVQIPEADAYRTVHYVITEIKRGQTDIPSLMHQKNHTELISLTALQRRGYCRDSCTVFRLMPNVPFFLPLALADLMTDCAGNKLEPIASLKPQGNNTRRGSSLKRIIGHLTAVTDGALSFPAALADGTGGDGGWQGLERINGARYSDLKQALNDFNTIYGPQQWRELLQQEVPGLTVQDIDWLSTIKEDVRPKRKTKQRSPLVDSGKRKRDKGAHRDPPGKQRRGERGTLATARADTNRAADNSRLEMPKPKMTDDNSKAEGQGGRVGEQEATMDDIVTEEEGNGSDAESAPSELAKSLRDHRPALQRIRRRLHGHDNAKGITNRLTALVLWISMQMTYTDIADPVFFLTDLGEGEEGGRNKGSRKSKRESLTSFQAPRYRQGPLELREEGKEQEEEGGRGGEGGEEGERRGQATPRTSVGTVTGGRGRGGSRETKRKATSELSGPPTSQAAGWRQLTLDFGGRIGEGREGEESGEGGEGTSRGQARRKTQLDLSTERRSADPPGTNRSDGQGPPSGLV